ncbi:MAG: NUDIX hydrolase [Candidatus Paceibacterota bacterium]|jgi:ADP-ribose pyrophosphatase YjhB (NUDIX family)
MKVQKIPFDEFKKIYSRVPRLCVEVVFIRNNSLLLIKRTIEPAVGQWHTPGGTVLKGEDLENAVKRVAYEELGIKIKVLKFIGIIEYKSYINHYSQDISLAFLVESKSKDINLDGHADEYNFFSEIPKNTILEQKKFYFKNLDIKISKK